MLLPTTEAAVEQFYFPEADAEKIIFTKECKYSPKNNKKRTKIAST